MLVLLRFQYRIKPGQWEERRQKWKDERSDRGETELLQLIPLLKRIFIGHTVMKGRPEHLDLSKVKFRSIYGMFLPQRKLCSSPKTF
jgi:hypothetical protein